MDRVEAIAVPDAEFELWSTEPPSWTDDRVQEGSLGRPYRRGHRLLLSVVDDDYMDGEYPWGRGSAFGDSVSRDYYYTAAFTNARCMKPHTRAIERADKSKVFYDLDT